VAVGYSRTDDWIRHLVFEGRRETVYGPVDGIWYGVLSGDGDATGGNFTLNGRLSYNRKEDWVYILGGVTLSRNDETESRAYIIVNTGPQVSTGSAVNNPSFPKGGVMKAISGNNISVLDLADGGADSRSGMPIFGDKSIAGLFLMIAAGIESNTNLVTYQLSSWGWLVRYQGFFRNRDPRVG